MRTAIVHYWLLNMRGGEKVVESLCELFPDADIFTHVYVPDNISGNIKTHKVRTTFIQKLPKSGRLYQNYLPFMPLALEQLDLRGYDLVISSESGPAKGVLTSPDTLHVCYCHTPMRYLWDMYHDYRADAGFTKRLLMPILTHYLRMWDVASADRVDNFIANSTFIAKRIRKYYRREAKVIFPPVDTEKFMQSNKVEDFYLVVGQLTPYKRVDIAVDAFKENGKKLIVIGEGEMLSQLKKNANTSNISFMGRQSFSVIQDHYSRCKALIFPGLEDFGIVPVEAMASGRPVIAYGRGGVKDTVIEGETGIFFDDQSPESLNEAIRLFELSEFRFKPRRIVEHARKFDRSRFLDSMKSFIDERFATFQE